MHLIALFLMQSLPKKFNVIFYPIVCGRSSLTQLQLIHCVALEEFQVKIVPSFPDKQTFSCAVHWATLILTLPLKSGLFLLLIFFSILLSLMGNSIISSLTAESTSLQISVFQTHIFLNLFFCVANCIQMCCLGSILLKYSFCI